MSTRTAQLALIALAAGGASARIRSADEFGRNAGAEQYKKFEMAEEDEVFWSRTLHGSMVHGSMSMDMGMTPEAPEESEEEELVTIPATAIANGGFTTLVAALQAAGLVEALSAPEPRLTVFAPTDEAFGNLPDGLVDCLLLANSSDVLTSILAYHVLAVEVFKDDLSDGMTAPTLLADASVTVGVSDGVVMIDRATVIAADVKASNGVIHVIDTVLVPDSVDVPAFLLTCNSSQDTPSADVVAETAAVGGASGTSPAVGDIISDQLESMMEASAVDLEPLNNALDDSSSSRVLVGLSCLVGAFGMLFI